MIKKLSIALYLFFAPLVVYGQEVALHAIKGDYFLEKEKYELAIDHYLTSLASFPDNTHLQLRLARAYSLIEQYDSAFQLYDLAFDRLESVPIDDLFHYISLLPIHKRYEQTQSLVDEYNTKSIGKFQIDTTFTYWKNLELPFDEILNASFFQGWIYFAAKENPDDETYALFKVSLANDESIRSPLKMDGIQMTEGNFAIDSKNRILYFLGKKQQLFSTAFPSEPSSAPVLIKFPKIKSKVSGLAYDANADRFVLSMLSGDQLDLFEVNKDTKGQWTKPQLIPQLSTSKNEVAPSFKNEKLYYASTAPNGQESQIYVNALADNMAATEVQLPKDVSGKCMGLDVINDNGDLIAYSDGSQFYRSFNYRINCKSNLQKGNSYIPIYIENGKIVRIKSEAYHNTAFDFNPTTNYLLTAKYYSYDGQALIRDNRTLTQLPISYKELYTFHFHRIAEQLHEEHKKKDKTVKDFHVNPGDLIVFDIVPKVKAKHDPTSKIIYDKQLPPASIDNDLLFTFGYRVKDAIKSQNEDQQPDPLADSTLIALQKESAIMLDDQLEHGILSYEIPEFEHPVVVIPDTLIQTESAVLIDSASLELLAQEELAARSDEPEDIPLPDLRLEPQDSLTAVIDTLTVAKVATDTTSVTEEEQDVVAITQPVVAEEEIEEAVSAVAADQEAEPVVESTQLIAENVPQVEEPEAKVETTAVETLESSPPETTSDRLVFRVQIAAAVRKMTDRELQAIYSGPLKIESFVENPYNKYYIIETPDYNKALQVWKSCQVEDAFIVAYLNDQKIDLRQARAMARNNTNISTASKPPPPMVAQATTPQPAAPQPVAPQPVAPQPAAPELETAEPTTTVPIATETTPVAQEEISETEVVTPVEEEIPEKDIVASEENNDKVKELIENPPALTKVEPKLEPKANANAYDFRIQVAASKSPLSSQELDRLQVTDKALTKDNNNGTFKYYISIPDDYFEAKTELAKVRAQIPNAFLSVYKDDKRVSSAEVLKTLYAKPKEGYKIPTSDTVQQVFTVRFDYDAYIASEQALRVLKDEVVPLMKQNPALYAISIGNTDERGTEYYNYALSQRRADFVKDRLIQLGISPDKISTKYFGESQLAKYCPKHEKCGEEIHQANRRVEILLVRKKD